MKHTLAYLSSTLQRIYQKMKNAEVLANKNIVSVHPLQRESSINLIHYLALRREDLRPVQDLLHDAGLSSLASSESHIMHQIQAVLTRLGAHFSSSDISPGTATVGMNLLHKRAADLFGSKEDQDIPHLMVTFDTELACSYESVKSLLKAGMNIARINCAHDSPDEWRGMIDNVHRASIDFGRPCKIYMDLAGPKIRTILYGKGRHKGRMKLKQHEQIFLSESDAFYDKKEKVIGCTLPGVVKDLRPGDRVLFDDGLFEALVEIPGERIATLRVSRISSLKHQLKSEKGINFPDTLLTVQCLTDYDKTVLPFAHENADLLGYSFVHTAADVQVLQTLLQHNGSKKIPIILKIETLEAVQNLPALLLQGMQEPVFGVMIARGDLAVEIGFERLSEIQEEILWLCEAAHVPVIWATQVLETLNKTGIATRSEITDVVSAGQAECVMLNKGKHLLTVISTLQNILHRSGGHHAKKRYIFRPLMIAERYLGSLISDR